VDDRDIIRGLKQGQREAWLGLYDAYADRVWRAAARLIGAHSADVGDVVQETLLAAARSARTFDPARQGLWPWLWGITRNQAALYHRRRAVEIRRALPAGTPITARGNDWKQWIAGEEDAPPAILESRELAMLVRVALTELPEDYSFLLVAKYIDGEPIDRIAQDAGLSPSAVMSKLARARRAFRTSLLRLTRSSSPCTERA
jgi:RNA polymerase sigma-70 factor, ECF subfamily